MSTKIKVVLGLLIVSNLIFAYLFYNSFSNNNYYNNLYKEKESEFLQLGNKFSDLKRENDNKKSEISELKSKVNSLEKDLNVKKSSSSKKYNTYVKEKNLSTFQDVSKKNNLHKQVSSSYRIGAICSDGTRSYATGRGACSHHGGVAYWLYSDGSKR